MITKQNKIKPINSKREFKWLMFLKQYLLTKAYRIYFCCVFKVLKLVKHIACLIQKYERKITFSNFQALYIKSFFYLIILFTDYNPKVHSHNTKRCVHKCICCRSIYYSRRLGKLGNWFNSEKLYNALPCTCKKK